MYSTSSFNRSLYQSSFVLDFLMSRSIQDKYDNQNNSANNRRQYRLMSPEEVAAGKKSYWTELEITGENFYAFYLEIYLWNYKILHQLILRRIMK